MTTEERELLNDATILLDKIGRGHPMAGKRTEARLLVRKIKNQLSAEINEAMRKTDEEAA